MSSFKEFFDFVFCVVLFVVLIIPHTIYVLFKKIHFLHTTPRFYFGDVIEDDHGILYRVNVANINFHLFDELFEFYARTYYEAITLDNLRTECFDLYDIKKYKKVYLEDLC